MSSKADVAPLSFREKVAYGVGDMASNFYLGFFSLYLLYYYTDVYGIAPAAVGLMLLISKLTDAFTDPAMGLIADRTESRWGKYRPYLLFVAIPYGLLGFAIFFGPDLSPTGKLIYAYMTYIGVMIAFTAINVPYSGLLAVISPLAEERTKATTYRFIFAGLGGLFVAAFATPLVKYLGAGDDVLGFRLTIAVFAVLSIAMFWFTFAGTKERIVLPKHKSSVKDDLSELVKNISWVVLAVCSILIIIGLVARFSSVIYYVKYYMQDDGETIFLFFDRVALFSSIGLLGQVVGALVTPYFTKFMSKHKITMIACFVHTVLLIISFYVPPEYYWTSTILHFFGIAMFGIIITLLFAMYTDCAEYGEWKTGARSSGLTVSASMFALKAGSAIGGALPGFILAAVGFIANEAQSDASMMGIRLMATVLPAVLFALGGISMLFYKIDNATLQKIENELLVSREENAAKAQLQ